MKAFVLLYNGTEMPTKASASIIDLLYEAGIIIDKNNIDVFTLNEKDIVKAIIPTVSKQENQYDEALVNAFTFLGGLYHKNFGDTTALICSVAQDLTNGGSIANEVRNALYIISTKKGTIPSELFKKYDITPEVITTLQRLYKYYVQD